MGSLASGEPAERKCLMPFNVGPWELLIFAIVPLLFFLATSFFWWLWNATIPEVFGLKQITYWQALRLLVIAALVLNLGIG